MEQSKILNWQNVLIFAMILSFSPFYISTGSFVFHYSILGYGLAMISFYYKKKLKKIDALIIASLLLILFCGFTKRFEWYGFFNFTFYVLVIVMVYLSTENILIRIISHFLIFISGIIFPARFLFINFTQSFHYLIFFDYTFGAFSVFLLLIRQFLENKGQNNL